MRQRSYDKEFKLNALSLHKGGMSAAQVCRDLGIPDSTFDGWIKCYREEGDAAFSGSGVIKASNQDIHALKKELEDVKLERDILKKAVAIFSKQK